MKKYSREYIGKEYQTNEGYTALVIDGGSSIGYCTIQIKNWIEEVQIGHLKNKNIKYPYHPSVYGIGYIGVGKYRAVQSSMGYKTWNNMLRRCYDLGYHTTRPTYIGCIVDPEWLNYQLFSKWFANNCEEGFVLDKDLLIEGNKVYSPYTCVLIPQCLNSFMTNIKSNNASGYTGVSWDKDKGKWGVNISDIDTKRNKKLGRFKDLEEASCVYQKARAEMADRMREKMINKYNITDQRILDAIR